MSPSDKATSCNILGTTVERACLPPLPEYVRHESGRFHTFDEEKLTMGKGNNSTKNDKKNKKPKADAKKADPKAAEHKK